MVSQKRLTWLILSILVFTTGIMFVATRQTSGEANIQQTRQRTRTKILRRYDRLSLKPSGQEVQDNQAPPPEERFLENTIPNHVPIKIKIRKEKEKGFKDLGNKGWAREFELEVKNTGDKPIYYLSLLLVTDVKSSTSGLTLVFPLIFGRTELGDVRVKPEVTDIPIKSGETHLFRIHAGQLQAWEARNREQRRPQPKRIQIKLQILSFGDGTGSVGGVPISEAGDEQTNLGRCLEPPNEERRVPFDWRRNVKTSMMLNFDEPANFLPVKFLSASFRETGVLAYVNPQSCCTGDGCAFLIARPQHVCLNCQIRQESHLRIALTVWDDVSVLNSIPLNV